MLFSNDTVRRKSVNKSLQNKGKAENILIHISLFTIRIWIEERNLVKIVPLLLRNPKITTQKIDRNPISVMPQYVLFFSSMVLL